MALPPVACASLCVEESGSAMPAPLRADGGCNTHCGAAARVLTHRPALARRRAGERGWRIAHVHGGDANAAALVEPGAEAGKCPSRLCNAQTDARGRPAPPRPASISQPAAHGRAARACCPSLALLKSAGAREKPWTETPQMPPLSRLAPSPAPGRAWRAPAQQQQPRGAAGAAEPCDPRGARREVGFLQTNRPGRLCGKPLSA